MINRTPIPGRAPFGGRGIPQQPIGMNPLGAASVPFPVSGRTPAPNIVPQNLPSQPVAPIFRPRPIMSMKKGGKVKKTGTYRLHAGEKVVPARGVKDVVSHEYNFRKKKR